MSKFSRRLELALDLSGLSARELAQKAECHESLISQYRSGRVKPRSTDRVYLIAKALNVSPGWLMGYDSPMQPTDSDIITAYNSLTPQNKLQVLDYIKYLQSKQTEEDEDV